MFYKVIRQEKLLCVWGEDVSADEISRYRQNGYRIAYFTAGSGSLREALQEIVLRRC